MASGVSCGMRLYVVGIKTMRAATAKTMPPPQMGTADAFALKKLAKQAGEAAQLLKLLGNEKRLLILCFLAVGLGAFGSHALKVTLQENGMLDVWNKAVLYHFLHAVALVALALHGAGNRVAYFLIVAGILFFSGSLYALALTNAGWLGAITPIGGLCFLAGWAWLIVSPKM